MTIQATKRVAGRGWYPAKRVQDLRPGDVLVRPYKAEAVVREIRLGDYNAFLRLEGVDRPFHIGIHKRLGTLVAVERRRRIKR